MTSDKGLALSDVSDKQSEKIPSQMEVALRYDLLTLFALFTLFTLFDKVHVCDEVKIACMFGGLFIACLCHSNGS